MKESGMIMQVITLEITVRHTNIEEMKQNMGTEIERRRPQEILILIMKRLQESLILIILSEVLELAAMEKTIICLHLLLTLGSDHLFVAALASIQHRHRLPLITILLDEDDQDQMMDVEAAARAVHKHHLS